MSFFCLLSHFMMLLSVQIAALSPNTERVFKFFVRFFSMLIFVHLKC